MDGIRENWNTIKETIRREYNLSNISYNTWVEPLEFHNVVDDVVNIVIPSDKAHALNYISNKYKSFFQVTITEMFDHNYDINFILEKDAQAVSDPGEAEVSMAAPSYNIGIRTAQLKPQIQIRHFCGRK